MLGQPEVSLVVSTIGRPAELRRLIDSLDLELLQGPSIELIVVDQSEHQVCRQVLTALERDPTSNLTWRYLVSAGGVSLGRNVGMSIASGDLIMFPDDDAWFDGNTLSLASAHLAAHPEHHGLCTQLQDGHGRPSLLRWADRATMVTKRNHHRTSIGSTMLFRREAVASVGGFDETMGPGAGGWYGSCEDADFLLRVIEQGARIWYDPAVVMNHRDSRLDGGPVAEAKALSYGCGQGLLWRSHRFPIWLILGLALRRLTGGTLWSLRGRPDIGRAHRAWVRGSINGWLGRPPLDLESVAPPVAGPAEQRGQLDPLDPPTGSHAPTSIEFGRSLSWRLLVAPIGTVAMFVLTTIVARSMSPADVTVSYTLLAALMIGPILGRFGLNQWAVRDLAATRATDDLGAAIARGRQFARAVIGPAAVAAPLIAFVFIAGAATGRFDLRIALLATVILFAETWRLAIGDVLIGLGQTGWAALLGHQVRAAAVTVSVLAYLVLRPSGLDLDALLWLMVGVTGVLAAAGLLRLLSLPGGFEDDGDEAGSLRPAELIRRGLPFLAVDLVVVVVARGDIWLAAPALNGEVAARYGTASVVAALIGLPIGLASIALAPVVAGLGTQRRLDDIERMVRSLATAVAYALLPVLIVVILFGRTILESAYGQTYGDAQPYLLVLMIGNLALAVLGTGPTVLLMSGRHREAAAIGVGWLMVAAPMAVLAVVVGGPMALAVVSAGTTVVLYGLMAAAVWTTTGIRLLPYSNPSELGLGRRFRSVRSSARPVPIRVTGENESR